MRKFLISSISFILSVSLLLLTCEFYNMYTLSYIERLQGGLEVYTALKKSKQKTAAKTLIFGDSVGNQLYPCHKNHGNILSLACNQAISFAGYYFLLKNYFEANADSLPEEVIMLCHPYTLSNNLDQFAYHYFLKPFYINEYKPFIDEHLQSRIEGIPYYWSSQLPFIKTSDYTFEYKLPQEDFNLISPITASYLPRIIALVEKHNIQFRMVSVPIKDNIKGNVEKRWREATLANELVSFIALTKEYSQWDVRPDSIFGDNVHFIPSYTPQNYLNK